MSFSHSGDLGPQLGRDDGGRGEGGGLQVSQITAQLVLEVKEAVYRSVRSQLS
jgi:hypothetical protein